MNQVIQINSSEPLENLIRPFGSTWTVYAGTLYGLTPLSIMAAFMNIITYFILRQSQFKTSTIFKYLKYNVLNSLIISLILATKIISTVYKFDFTNSYASSFYGNFFFGPFLAIFYLNGNLLDIFITIERILKIHPIEKIKKIIKLKFFWLFLFILSLIINMPNFFITSPAFVDLNINNKTLIRSYFTQQTNFSISTIGKVVSFLIFLLRDCLTLIVKIYLNIVSVVLIKKYFSKLSTSATARFERHDSIKITNETNINPKKTYMTKVDKNLTYIAIAMCILSSFENIFFIVTYIYLAFGLNQTGWTLYFCSNLINGIKHGSNLFILYFFNNLFKKEFINIFFKQFSISK